MASQQASIVTDLAVGPFRVYTVHIRHNADMWLWFVLPTPASMLVCELALPSCVHLDDRR